MPIYDLTSDISAISWNIGNLKVDKRTTYSFINPENKKVPETYPFSILLEEKPYSVAGVSIAGFTEILVQPTAGLTFYVDYEDSTIYFDSSDASKLIEIYYMGMGSVVSASNINKFSTFLTSVRDFLLSFSIEAADTSISLYLSSDIPGISFTVIPIFSTVIG